jgi:DedD protein
MRLPFIRPQSAAAAGADRPERGVDEPGALQAARTKARRRLLGAVVLLLAAVAGFPLLFETQPRPLPGSVVIDGSGLVIRGEPAGRAAPADAVPARNARAPQSAASGAVAAAAAAAGRVAAGSAATPAVSAPIAAAPAAPAAAVAKTAAVAPASAPAAAAPAVSTAALTPPAASAAGKAAAARKAETSASAPNAAPAKVAKVEAAKVEAAKVEAAPATAATAAAAASAATEGATVRWVVQVGAYNDMERMRQARQKAEKLGFKTYITEVDTPTGKRTRVRLGPFATRKEADAAAVKVKANGMAANVLSV